MKVCQSSTFKNSYSGLPSLLQNHGAGFGCPCFLAEESFFQNEQGAPEGKQSLLWPGGAGGLAEPCPLPEMPLSHDSLPRTSMGTDPVSYLDIQVPVLQAAGFGSGLVPIWGGGINVFVSPAQAWEQCSPTSTADHVLFPRLETLTTGFSSPFRQLIQRNTTALCGISKTTRTLPHKACPGCTSLMKMSSQTSKAGFLSLSLATRLSGV